MTTSKRLNDTPPEAEQPPNHSGRRLFLSQGLVTIGALVVSCSSDETTGQPATTGGAAGDASTGGKAGGISGSGGTAGKGGSAGKGQGGAALGGAGGQSGAGGASGQSGTSGQGGAAGQSGAGGEAGQGGGAGQAGQGGSGGSGPPPIGSRVVHVYSPSVATSPGSSPFYSVVNQTTIDAMVLAGLQELTQLSSWPSICDALFRKVNPSGYQPGEKIALKVNFNNSGRDGNTCSQHNNLVDALPHPVLSLISGLVAAGVSTTNIIVYDATQQGRIIPSYFRDALTTAHPGVVLVGKADCTGVVGATHGAHPSLTVAFQDPDSILKTPRLLADVLYNVAYLINIPIVKVHGGNAGTPVSLGFKNHFGSINEVYGSGTNNLHEYVSVAFTHYKTDYNPVVDIYKNPNVGPKTILTLGDGIFGGGSSAGGILSQWSTFSGPMRSLFFGVDPVALDCVMADFIVTEGLVNKTHTYDYLFCAEEAGLGVCEGTRQNPGGNPWQTPYGSGYSKITYVRKDVS